MTKEHLDELDRLARRVTADGGGGVAEISGNELASLVSAARQLEATTTLLRIASKPDWDVYSTDTDNWYALENSPFGKLHSAETAEELVALLNALPEQEP